MREKIWRNNFELHLFKEVLEELPVRVGQKHDARASRCSTPT
jgi:hypothetical protein